MSSENHGVPEDDDPFAYLYRGEGEAGSAAQETSPLPGVPRTSYHQATQVGRTQYGQQPQQTPQGYPQLPHQDQPTAKYTAPGSQPQQYGAPSGPYPGQQSAPPAQPGGRAGARAGSGGGRNSRGVMIGTVAVVVAVVIGICVALFNSGPDKSPTAGGSSTAPAGSTASTGPTDSPTPTADPTTGEVPPADAATMTLAGGAKTNNNWKGALGAGGTFVDGMTNVGATVTWNVTAPAKGDYYLWIRFANATGKDASAAVTVDQKPLSSPIPLKDYGSDGKWTSWFSTYRTISLDKGPNTVALSCVAGADCTFNLDQLALTPPVGGSDTRPSGW
ncbi:carbohydrate-binding protein [Streptacidiphilus cavernicola]|uniref:Carbohydrate-binding protein n=1 Tax=Streptacidiphilus cavernicola TaxID=3342716 RepID=A0ABV6VNT6_9ACTN